MSTTTLIDAVLKKVPDADPSVVLDLIVACNADLNQVFQLLGVQQQSRKRQMTFDSFTSKRPARRFKTSADVVNLYTPEQVKSADINCSLYLNALDPSVANQLAIALNDDATHWNHRRFYLFDREVQSGHKSSIYTCDEAILSDEEKTTYQGRVMYRHKHEVFPFSPELHEARKVVEEHVRQFVPEWECSVAVMNQYSNKHDKLDYHSDQLTHLGVKPTIASLSLGCTREFRLKDRSVPPQRPIYSIHIPHNSLLIMHGGCQERFKHCVPPASSVESDPLLGSSRISCTFRMYKMNREDLPLCKCNKTMILRNTLPDKEGKYKYIWQCSSGYEGEQSCELVKQADEKELP